MRCSDKRFFLDVLYNIIHTAEGNFGFMILSRFKCNLLTYSLDFINESILAKLRKRKIIWDKKQKTISFLMGKFPLVLCCCPFFLNTHIKLKESTFIWILWQKKLSTVCKIYVKKHLITNVKTLAQKTKDLLIRKYPPCSSCC